MRRILEVNKEAVAMILRQGNQKENKAQHKQGYNTPPSCRGRLLKAAR
jgi:hypothetical protein